MAWVRRVGEDQAGGEAAGACRPVGGEPVDAGAGPGSGRAGPRSARWRSSGQVAGAGEMDLFGSGGGQGDAGGAAGGRDRLANSSSAAASSRPAVSVGRPARPASSAKRPRICRSELSPPTPSATTGAPTASASGPASAYGALAVVGDVHDQVGPQPAQRLLGDGGARAEVRHAVRVQLAGLGGVGRDAAVVGGAVDGDGAYAVLPQGGAGPDVRHHPARHPRAGRPVAPVVGELPGQFGTRGSHAIPPSPAAGPGRGPGPCFNTPLSVRRRQDRTVRGTVRSGPQRRGGRVRIPPPAADTAEANGPHPAGDHVQPSPSPAARFPAPPVWCSNSSRASARTPPGSRSPANPSYATAPHRRRPPGTARPRRTGPTRRARTIQPPDGTDGRAPPVARSSVSTARPKTSRPACAGHAVEQARQPPHPQVLAPAHPRARTAVAARADVDLGPAGDDPAGLLQPAVAGGAVRAGRPPHGDPHRVLERGAPDPGTGHEDRAGAGRGRGAARRSG